MQARYRACKEKFFEGVLHQGSVDCALCSLNAAAAYVVSAVSGLNPFRLQYFEFGDRSARNLWREGRFN